MEKGYKEMELMKKRIFEFEQNIIDIQCHQDHMDKNIKSASGR